METMPEVIEATGSTPEQEAEAEAESAIDNASYWIWQKIQLVVDRLAPYTFTRWVFAIFLFSFYVYRAAINQGIVGTKFYQ